MYLELCRVSALLTSLPDLLIYFLSGQSDSDCAIVFALCQSIKQHVLSFRIFAEPVGVCVLVTLLFFNG